MHERSSSFADFFSRISYRWVLLTPFVILVLVSGTIVGYLSLRTGTESVERMIDDLQHRIQVEVFDDLDVYLDEAMHLVDANAVHIERGVVDPYDVDQRDPYFASGVELWPHAAMSFFGDTNGEFYGARRTTDGTIEVVRNNETTGGASRYFSVDEMGRAVELMAEFPNFDPRVRPWFTGAVGAGAAVFSPIYKHFVFDDLAITASVPIYNDSDGSLLGVVGVDYLLGRINSFFAETAGDDGIVLIAVEERDHLLIANSLGIVNFATDADGNLVRIGPNDVDDERLGALMDMISNDRIGETERSNGLIVNQFQFGRTNLSWHFVLSIPEDLFLADIRRIGRTTNAFLVATLLIAALLGYYLSRLVTVPVQRLADSADRLAQQEWGTEVVIGGSNEVARLSGAFNRMASDLRELVENLESKVAARTAELEALNRTKDRFFAIIAHDLRGPLMAATMALDHVIAEFDQLETADLRSLIDMTAARQKSAQQLLENLLIWAMAQRGELSYSPSDTALDELVAEVLLLVENKAEAKQIRIVHNTDSPVATCDRDMIATVLRNLVTNAIKYSYPGGTVTIRSLTRDDGSVAVEITDEGTGIKRGNIANLTSVATNRSMPGTAGEKGTALGLVLCKEFLLRHGSDLDISSELGRGSTFSFRLEQPTGT